MAPHAQARVVGLSLVERGRRVATRAGARRVFVLDAVDADATAALRRWDEARGDAALLVLQAGDQVVHTGLVTPLLAGASDRRLAVGPDGAYAGALWARGAAADEAIAALAAAPDGGDAQLVARWHLAERIAHDPIARHPATTRAERAGAERMLLRLLDKSEDGAVTRYIYRPVSRPISRLLVRTPIRPNQVSIVVGLLGLVGCWYTAQAGQRALIIGACLILAGGFLDGCDGELARLRLTSSKLGAWLDTVVDELTTTGYLVATGLHAYAEVGASQTWIAPTIPIGLGCYLLSIYGIYYFLVVVSKTGNSQHYVGALDLVDDPRDGLGLRPRAAATPSRLSRLIALLANVIRRDFINLAAVGLALLDFYMFLYVGMLAGGIVTALIVLPEHVRLRGQLRALRRRGAAPRLFPAA